MQAVEQVERFQATPKEAHVLVVKRIFRYLKGTTNFGLWYPKGNDLTLDTYIMQTRKEILMTEKVQVEQPSTWAIV